MEDNIMYTSTPSKWSRLVSLEEHFNDYQNESDISNINPFTPTMLLRTKIKSRCKRKLDSLLPIPRVTSIDSDSDCEQQTKRLALQNLNIRRYDREFDELSLISTGKFSSVYKCVNRLDGCTYAVKKSIKLVVDSIKETNALNEIYAYAVLSNHEHIVRYYSAWTEGNHIIIQNEYCNGGSLADAIAQKFLPEAKLHQLLLHIARGLQYIHSMHLVHMNIKPDNILISKEKRLNSDDDLDKSIKEQIIYKIGDFGHVTPLKNPQVMKGDCRYLPAEILREEFSHLLKADIFSLGLTVYEAGGGGPLPKYGPAWDEIREGNLKELSHCSSDFYNLLKLMIHSMPRMRPSALSLMRHQVLRSFENDTKKQLQHELNEEKLRNSILSKLIQKAANV